MTINKYRSIWISDVHLGTRACKSPYLIDFLKHNDCEYLYLVGDIIDIWRMEKSIYWPQDHNDILRRILTRSKRGTKVIYVIGNHDEKLKDFTPIQLGNISLQDEAIHITASGKKFLVTHGDSFDSIMKYHKWLARLGDSAYNFIVAINNVYNWYRRVMGKNYWSLSRYLKTKVKTSTKFITDYEELISLYAKKHNYDGVICGHIHVAEHKIINDIEYWNDGDWCESCTALLEHYDGTFELIEWQAVGQTKTNTPKTLYKKVY